MTLPPGFRFHPTDEELVDYYLKKRVKNVPIEFDVIADVDLYKCEPWDLPAKSKLPQVDHEWFFFSPRDRKYPNGSRTNRATEAGYWKATGRDRTVRQATKVIGMKKTLVFYLGRAPHGERTDWLMHEYRLDGEEWENMNVSQDAFVLCRVFKKNGFGPPKNPTGSGSMEEGVDQVDSPGEVKSSFALSDMVDVKPAASTLAILAPSPQPLAEMPGRDPGLGGEIYGGLRLTSGYPEDVFTQSGRFHFDATAVSGSGIGEGFFLDEGLDKIANDELEAFWKEVPPLQGNLAQLGDDQCNDIPALVDSEFCNEFKNTWQEQVAGTQHAWNGGQTLANKEDPVVLQNYPTLYENDFAPLPTLVQLPSPPTVSQVEDNDAESSSVSSGTNHFSPIQIRPRSSVSSSVAGYAPQYTTTRLVRLQQRGRNHILASDDVPSTKSSHRPSPPVVSLTEKVETEHDQSPPLGSQAPTPVTRSEDCDTSASNVTSSSTPEVAVEGEGRTSCASSFTPVLRKGAGRASVSMLPYLKRRGQALAPPSTDKIFDDNLSFTDAAVSQSVASDGSSPSKMSDDGGQGMVVSEKESEADDNLPVENASTLLGERTCCKPLQTIEAPVENTHVTSELTAESSSLKKVFVDDSNPMRILGMGIMAPLRAVRPHDSTGSGKQAVSSSELPAGIGSIHVNAVTIRCSCSSAGVPHVATTACACYSTFWDSSNQKEKSNHQVPDVKQQPEADGGSVANSQGRFQHLRIFFSCLMAVVLTCWLFLLLGHSSVDVDWYSFFTTEILSGDSSFSVIELPSITFRDLFFSLFGAGCFYMWANVGSILWPPKKHRRGVNIKPPSSDV